MIKRAVSPNARKAHRLMSCHSHSFGILRCITSSLPPTRRTICAADVITTDAVETVVTSYRIALRPNDESVEKCLFCVHLGYLDSVSSVRLALGYLS